MAFANYPTGFSPAENRSGNPWNQQAHLYFIPSTDTNQYGLGDAVGPATSSDADGVASVQKITSSYAALPVTTSQGGSSATLTMTTTTGIVAGMLVGGFGILPGTYVSSVTANTSVTLSQPTTAAVLTTSGNLTFTAVPLGVIVGIRVADPGVSLQGPDLALSVLQIPATKTRGYYVYVVDDDSVIFEIPTDLVTPSNLVSGGLLVGASKCASYTVVNPTGNSPYSGTVLSTASISTNSALPLRIIGMQVRPDNLVTNLANNVPIRLRVIWNYHVFNGAALGF